MARCLPFCPKGHCKGWGCNQGCAQLGLLRRLFVVELDREVAPPSFSASGEAERTGTVWMDHRARVQAERINALGQPGLDYVGDRISPEMQINSFGSINICRTALRQRANFSICQIFRPGRRPSR